MARNGGPLLVAVGGLGAIGLPVARALDRGIEGLSLVAVSARDHGKARARLADFSTVPRVVALAELAIVADVVVECAPPAVFREIADPTLRAGLTLVPLSVGQLLLNPDLIDLASRTGANVIVPSGAMLGLDALRAATESELRSVRLVTRKPPQSLVLPDHLKREGISLDELSEAVRVFEGNAYEAAAAFPANINVGAALSLAGIGPERTRIEIWADPEIDRNTHTISVDADSCSFEMSIQSIPTEENPATGKLTPLSVINALRMLTTRFRIGS